MTPERLSNAAEDITRIELLTLLILAGTIYGFAVNGVARRRCGESLPSPGIERGSVSRTQTLKARRKNSASTSLISATT